MKSLGIFLVIISIGVLIYAFATPTTYDVFLTSTNTLDGTINELKQNLIIFGSVLFLGGLILIGFGSATQKKEDDGQPKKPWGFD